MAQEASSLSNVFALLAPKAKAVGGRLFADLIDGTYGDDNGNLFEVDSFYAQLAFVVLILGILGGLLTLATADIVRSNSPDFVGAISGGIEAIGLNNLFAKVDEVLSHGAGVANEAGASLAQAPYIAAQAAEDYLVKRVGLEGAQEYSQIRRRR